MGEKILGFRDYGKVAVQFMYVADYMSDPALADGDWMDA